LAAAWFPPPSVTPATALMPRSPFRNARFAVLVVAALATSTDADGLRVL
jgi:hypothetical protein